MCQSCWIHDHGQSTETTPNTARVVELYQSIYAENSAGGGLHIVLDDWNLGDGHIDWCIAEADLSPDEQECADLLRAMTMQQRAGALAAAQGWVA